MGLDAYAEVTTKNNWNDATCSPIDSEKSAMFSYWRKHHELNDWMTGKWFNSDTGAKADADAEFNCIPLRLSKEMLDELFDYCESFELYGVENFMSSKAYYLEIQKKDLEFISEAKKFIDEGLVVYYSCWW